jgi:hypothetical protein
MVTFVLPRHVGRIFYISKSTQHALSQRQRLQLSPISLLKGVLAAIVAAMLQGIIHAQILADQSLTAIASTVNEFLCSRATGNLPLWSC